jgi:hypothetical protein
MGGLSVTTECYAGSDVFVGLFTYDEFLRNEYRVGLHLSRLYDLERGVGVENLVDFFVNCGVDLRWLENEECFMEGKLVLLT